MITRILRISSHPIAYCSYNVKERYIIGLGCVLHAISSGHPNMRMLFERWGYSILNEDVSRHFQSGDKSEIAKALSLNREGWRFFRVKHQFYFDCFYLTEAFDKTLFERLKDFLSENGANIFTKSSLLKTYNHFASGEATLKVDDALQKHRADNIHFGEKKATRILVVATVSAGKSTLINALTGHFFNRTSTGVCTTRICEIHNKPVADGMTLKTGNTYSYGDLSDYYSSEDAPMVGVHFESLLGEHKVCIIDTPGVNNAVDTNHYKITEQAIKGGQYDCVIFVSNGLYNGTNDERRLLELLHAEVKKPVIFVLNQLDRFNSRRDDIGKMICDYAQELLTIGFKTPKIFPMSAQYALLLRAETQLTEDEADELAMMKPRFARAFYDLQRYNANPSETELEKSGIILLEKEIIKHINYHIN